MMKIIYGIPKFWMITFYQCRNIHFKLWNILSNSLQMNIFILNLAGLCENNLADYTTTERPPKFITRGHLYKTVIGDTIILPCKVKDLG